MYYGYLFAPFIAWFIAGTMKFLINSIVAKKPAIKQIGYGGLPSNHSAIVSCATTLIAIREGIGHPAFGIAIAVSFIVILDAKSLRGQIGKQARAINEINNNSATVGLRERIGHSFMEIGAGIVVGVFTAWLINSLYPI